VNETQFRDDLPILTLTRVALRFSEDSMAVCVNGGPVVSHIRPPDWETPRDRLSFSGSVFVRRIRIFDQLKTDTEMETLTDL
jgi:hypothetical protein